MAWNAKHIEEISYFVTYWKRIYIEITETLPTHSNALHEGFWLISNWRRDHTNNSSKDPIPNYVPDLTPEDDPESYPYCDHAKERPKSNFNPYWDVLLGNFILCWPSHNNHLPVWLVEFLAMLTIPWVIIKVGLS
jgi:hypothetical protein